MEDLRGSEQIIRSSFDADVYDELQGFFQNVWQSKASYKVFMARRAFNLNFAFMGMMDAQYVQEYRTDDIMSNTALLLYAEEIAEYYKAMDRFPSILIVDDLLIHGRGIIKLISNLESLVTEYINVGRIQKESQEKIHRRLLVALNIYVFARNAEDILLDERFALRAVMRLIPRDLKRLSQQISRALQQCAVANTSYVLSASLPSSFFRDEYFDAQKFDGNSLFQYRGNSLRYYYRNTNNRILETIRFYLDDENDFVKHKVTALVVFGDVSYSEGDFDQLCKEVADRLKVIIPYSRIVEILNYKQERLVRPRAQMLSYLLSILCFVDFCREKLSFDSNSLCGVLLQSDYGKIAANFGRAKRIQCELVQLFRYISHDDDLKKNIFAILEKGTDELALMHMGNAGKEYQIGRWTQVDESVGIMPSERIGEMAEDIFYEVGMNAEYRANQYIQTRTPFMVSKPGNDIIRLNQFLRLMRSDGVDEASSIGYVLSLMDSGLFAMNLELDQAGQRAQCVLKAGELSTFVLPRRFSVLVPALSVVERGYLRKGNDKKSVVSKFIDFLGVYCPMRGDCGEEDFELLDKLKRSKASLLYMYAAGQSFQDWNVDLLTQEERYFHGRDGTGKFDNARYLSWESNEKRRENYYSYCARMFLKHANT